MLIYFILLGIVMLCPAFYQNANLSRAKQRKYVLYTIFFCIYLLCALRSPEVGKDTLAYQTGYEWTKDAGFCDFDYICFEKGYLLLMKICILLHMPFQLYLAVVYLIITIPVVVFIDKYSEDVWLSSLIYICYMFLEFNMTGIRQAIAASICLAAFMILLDEKKHSLIKYILVVTLATYFHKSAFIGYFVLAAIWINSLQIYTMLLSIGAFIILFFRNDLMACVKLLFHKGSMDTSAPLYIGGNFILTMLISIFLIYTEVRLRTQKEIKLSAIKKNEKTKILSRNPALSKGGLLAKIYITSIIFLLLFGSETAVRSSMLLMQVIIVELPNCFRIFEKKSRKIMQLMLSIFLVAFFYTNALIANGFNIVPYKFFWQ